MTKKEAKIILQCRGNGYSEDEFNEALEIAYTALDYSLPDNLDEAAEEHINKALFKWSYDDEDGIEQYVSDAFKAGAGWVANKRRK